MLRELWLVRNVLIVLLTPIVLSPIAVQGQTRETRCAYGLAIVTVYWITAALPLAVTALLPVLIFPILEVVPVKQLVSNYVKDTSMFGISCLTFAIAVEKSQLHKRIAYKTLLLVGTNPKWLMLGFMLPTWFMSMWMSNTATTSMMLPIAQAVLDKLDTTETLDTTEDEHLFIEEQNSMPKVKKVKEKTVYYSRLCKGISLCIAYAANIGGSGSLTGTSPNLILQGQADLIFEAVGLESNVNFVTWMIFALPGCLISVFIAWLWLSFFFIGPSKWMDWKCKQSTEKGVTDVLQSQYKQLGNISFAEKAIILHFIALLCLWLSRKPPLGTGWGDYIAPGYIGDSVVASLIFTSLFVFPSERPKTLFFRSNKVVKPESVPALMDWNTLEKKFPWGVFLLIGGGFAIASACQESGLSRVISEQLKVFVQFEPWLMNLFLTLLVSVCTEVTSNSATSALLIPIIAQLAISLSINPLYLMWSCCISTSFAFMLPVATPPNAIVFATGHLTVTDMVMAGSVLNILCIIVLNIGVNTWGKAYFNLGVIPPEFLVNSTNILKVNETMRNITVL